VRKLIAAFMLTLSVMGGILATPGVANAVPVVGSYAPTQGEVIAEKHGDFFELTLSFSPLSA
jgi:hypothetical protein